MMGSAMVVLDSKGMLIERAKKLTTYVNQADQGLNESFSNASENLNAQSKLYQARSLNPVWHNETPGGEFNPYFMNRAVGDLRMSGPHTPLPRLSDIEEPLNRAYTRLFPIWLGVDRETLFIPADDSTALTQGLEISREESLFFVNNNLYCI